MRACSQSRGGLLEDVMPLQNINFKAGERQKAVVVEGVGFDTSQAFMSYIVFSFLEKSQLKGKTTVIHSVKCEVNR